MRQERSHETFRRWIIGRVASRLVEALSHSFNKENLFIWPEEAFVVLVGGSTLPKIKLAYLCLAHLASRFKFVIFNNKGVPFSCGEGAALIVLRVLGHCWNMH